MSNIIYIIFYIFSIIVSFSLGIILASIKIKDKDIEISSLNNQIKKYKENEEYRKLDVKKLDDDIELDKFMDSIGEDRK